MAGEINLDIEKYLDEKRWAVNMLIYNYSEPTRISDDTSVTLLSDERRRLTKREARFQLFNEYGELYIDGADLDDFRSQFFKRLAEKKSKILPQGTPNLRIVIDLINEIDKMGLRVVGSHQELDESWDCVYDNVIPDLKNHDLSFKKEPVPKKFAWDHVFYDVVDSDDNLVLKQIPEKMLGAALLSLVLKIKPYNIKQILLFPKISSDIAANADTRLRLENHYCSGFRVVRSISDIKLLPNIPIKKSDNYLIKKFQFVNSKNDLEYGGPFVEGDARDALIQVSYDLPDASKDDSKKLSDWIVKTADKAHVYIQRSERRQDNSYLVEHFIIKDNTIDDLIGNTQIADPEYNHETVFEVFDSSTEESMRYDLSFGELVTYLLSLLIKES
ncbi:hypothetical protein [Companilactobacillus jidongensis]|uniref:hypothetical protein n=1 Tax=Companilactobacillus jidongensis TaxID=2486006 RepID=UPI000F779E42|nr:hypothetical protein [Companilactobacillus jidongensis]